MSQHIIADVSRCNGCHTCELECAMAHSESGDFEKMAANLETPGYRIRIEFEGGKAVPHTCLQCVEPECLAACPTDAIFRLADDKPILVKDDECIGCRKCVKACPYDMMTMKIGVKIAMKCDLCIRRQASGKGPACVESCPTGTLSVSDEEVLEKEKQPAAAAR